MKPSELIRSHLQEHLAGLRNRIEHRKIDIRIAEERLGEAVATAEEFERLLELVAEAEKAAPEPPASHPVIAKGMTVTHKHGNFDGIAKVIRIQKDADGVPAAVVDLDGRRFGIALEDLIPANQPQEPEITQGMLVTSKTGAFDGTAKVLRIVTGSFSESPWAHLSIAGNRDLHFPVSDLQPHTP